MPRNLRDEARAWRAAARDLACWADERLVNRRDVWGAYIPPERRRTADRKSVTAPPLRDRGQRALTPSVLRDHFAGGRVIGLHASDGTASRWLAFDFDCHSDDDSTRMANLAASDRLADALRRRGFFPLVEDSDGRGGLHVWVILDRPAPTADVFALAEELRARLDVAAETFPKQAKIPSGGFGNWLRLPGHHHTRAHFSRIRRGDGWVSGAEAVRALLEAPLSPASRVPPAPTPRVAVVRRDTPRTFGAVGESNGTSTRRLLAYVRRVEHGLSDGRKRAAYRLGAVFLHDFALTSNRAAALLDAWNAVNVPPLDGDTLASILNNSRRYGRGGRVA